jgi:hypothetical protein
MPDTVESTPRASDTSLPPAGRVDQLDPDQVRVVDLEDTTGSVTRHDCYDPEGCLNDGDLEGVRSVFRLVDGEVHVRAIDWARSRSLDPSIELHWVATGLHVEDIERIRVFTWPEAELAQVFKHMS